MKQCPHCAKEGAGPLPLEQFSKCKTNPDGLDTYCKRHRSLRQKARYARVGDVYKERGAAWRKNNPKRLREYQVKKRLKEFGLTEETYNSLFDKQNGACAICERPLSNGFTAARVDDPPKSSSIARVDHCHVSGKVRGLLCINCNTGIGHLKDSEVLLLSAVRYLRESATVQRDSRTQHDTLKGESGPESRDPYRTVSRGSRRDELSPFIN